MRAIRFVLFTVVLVFAGAGFAYQVNLDPTSVSLSPSTVSQFAGYEAVTLRDGIGLPTQPGNPGLPGLPVLVALPPGMEIESVTINHAEPYIMPGYHKIIPAQTPTPIGKTAVIVAANPTAYASTAPFPGNLVNAYSTGGMSGYAIGNVLFAPIQYTPLTGQLVIYRNIDFTINLKPSSNIMLYPHYRLDWVAAELEKSIKAAVINPNEVSAPPVAVIKDELKGGGNSYPYLIITNSAQTTSAAKLADWKTRKGLKTKVITLDEIMANYSGVDTADKIRNCIIDYYTDYATQYVLLIGSGSSIPMRYCYDPSFDTEEGNYLVPTDNYYACLEGDWNHDGDGYWGEPSDNVDLSYEVFVGRIQTDTDAALAPVVDKILCYEGTNLATETNPYDYQGKALLAGGWLDSSTNEMIMMSNIQSTYLTDPSFTCTDLWDSSYPGGSVFNSTAFIAAMNGGPGIITHAMHANSNIMATNSGYVYNTDFYALTNHPRFTGFLNTVGCYDANIDYIGNCATDFVNSPTGGGVGFVGNTRYGWYMPGQPGTGPSDAFTNEFINQYAIADHYQNGQALALSKAQFASTVMSDYITRFIFYELYLTGDPDIWVPNSAIAALAVTNQQSIPGGQQSYTVQVSDSSRGPTVGALVCCYKENETHAAGFTDASGSVTLNITPQSLGIMHLTVSAHNRKTFEADVQVSSGATGVNLISFTGQRSKNGAELSWRVSNASDGVSFNLYRRSASKTASAMDKGNSSTATAAFDKKNTVGWTLVNSSPIGGRNPYSYLDRSVGTVKYEYALEVIVGKRHGLLGNTNLPAGAPVAFSLSVSPNPVRSLANITIGMETAGSVNLKLYDLAGRMVKTVSFNLASGTNLTELNLTGLATGIYSVQAECSGTVLSRRIVVAR